MFYSNEEYFDCLKELMINIFVNNYSYYYLKYCYKYNKEYGFKKIITGSSYAKNGLIVGNLNGGYSENINLSIDSQDLFYDFCHIKKIIKEGKRKPEICIINSGYYVLYQDLSLSKEEGCVINYIYEPIFHELHHWEISDDLWNPLKNMKFNRDMFPEDIILRLCEEWSLGVLSEQREFYNKVAGFRYKVFEKDGMEYLWDQLSEEERESLAYERAMVHNQLIRHEHSRDENSGIIYDMVEYCIKNDVKPIFIIFPFTKYYNKYINDEYKDELYECLNELPFPVEFFDMNDTVWYDTFSDKDFVDSDHLSDIGAHKATMIINDFLSKV